MVSAPATGSKVMWPSTIQRSRSVASGRTTPRTCRGVVIRGMLRAVLRHQSRPAPPVYDGDFPDPFVLVGGDRYFAYGTQTGEINVQVMESADLAGWEHRGDALPELPPWAGWGRTGSPAVLRRDDSYVLYYAVRHEAAGRQCISVATGSDPAGPFVDRSAE